MSEQDSGIVTDDEERFDYEGSFWWHGVGLYVKRTAVLSAVGLVLASQAAQLLHLTGVI